MSSVTKYTGFLDLGSLVQTPVVLLNWVILGKSHNVCKHQFPYL